MREGCQHIAFGEGQIEAKDDAREDGPPRVDRGKNTDRAEGSPVHELDANGKSADRGLAVKVEEKGYGQHSAKKGGRRKRGGGGWSL